MRFLTKTKVDFMKYRKVFVWVSLLLLTVACIELFALKGLNLGIDFAGGTQMTVALRDEVSTDTLRGQLASAGLGDAVIQTYGLPEERMVLIKTPVVEGSEEGSAEVITRALDTALNQGDGSFDLNQRGTQAVTDFLFEKDPDGLRSGDEDEARSRYEEMASAVLAVRRPIFLSVDELDAVEGLSPAARDVLKNGPTLGAFHVLSAENVGPQIGEELTRKGIWAVTLSLLGMLAYIWYRFELRFGVGALVAVFHDFLICLGLFALIDYEFNLPTIAAFLTLVGYSVNDTVVIFDRVRENMRRHRRKPLVDVMNESLNQTLSRTILTSGTTLLVVGCLFVLGGEVIRGFAFVLLIGIVIGTYSSVFVASPFALLWEKYFGGEGDQVRKAEAA